MHADFVDDAVRTLRAAAPGDLSRVSEAAAVMAHADHLLVQVVRDARAAGRSWSQIAVALQTSTADARARWGPARQGGERTELRWSSTPCAGEDHDQQLVSAGVGLVVAGERAVPGAKDGFTLGRQREDPASLHGRS